MSKKRSGSKQQDNDEYPDDAIFPKLRRCKLCLLLPPCNHVSYNQAVQALRDEINSLPKNKKKNGLCEEFNHLGICSSYLTRGRCRFYHPKQRVILPKKMSRSEKRCPVCTLPDCHEHREATKLRNKIEKRIWVPPTPSALPTEPKPRCFICTLPLPCAHFGVRDDMNSFLEQEKARRSMYPTKGETAERCLYFLFTGTCPSFDSSGTCLFWHPPRYANHAIRLEDELDKEDHELVGYGHGFSGLPGAHRSTGPYGNAEYNPESLKVSRRMINQDIQNTAEVRRKLEFGHGRTRKFKAWKISNPPLSRAGLLDKDRKLSWKEDMRRRRHLEELTREESTNPATGPANRPRNKVLTAAERRAKIKRLKSSQGLKSYVQKIMVS
jgi:hypothetical protein